MSDGLYHYDQPKVNFVAPKNHEVGCHDLESIRREHRSTESNIKTVGGLLVVGAMLMISLGSSGLGSGTRATNNLVFLYGLWLICGILQAFIAVGLFKLRSWARIPAIVLSVVAALFTKPGIGICACALPCLTSKRAKIVMTEEYREIIRQTPHVKQKVSKITWVFIALSICAILALLYFINFAN